MTNGSVVSTNTIQQVPSHPSDITVDTFILRLDHSSFAAQTSGPGTGGNITVESFAAGGRLSIRAVNGSSLSASSDPTNGPGGVLGPSGNAGSIQLTGSAIAPLQQLNHQRKAWAPLPTPVMAGASHSPSQATCGCKAGARFPRPPRVRLPPEGRSR